MQIAVKRLDGGDAGAIELNEAVFGCAPRPDILHRVVVWQLANRRAPARASKERSEVSRTGKKFGRQKGGGTARHGNRAAPQFIGGGKAHGPRARTFDQGLNKKIRALGLRTALSVKAAEGKLIVLEDLALAEAKTKLLQASLARLGLTRALFIDGDAVDMNFRLACQNLYRVDVLPAVGANVYDILKHDALVLSRAGVEQLVARLAGGTDGAAEVPAAVEAPVEAPAAPKRRAGKAVADASAADAPAADAPAADAPAADAPAADAPAPATRIETPATGEEATNHG